MRLGNLLVALALLVLLLVIVDPNARQKAVAFVNRLNHTVVVNAPSVNDNDSDESSTPVPILTPIPTAVADSNKVIPNTGSDDTNHQPIIQVNWDALNAALRRFWDSLRNIKINLNPAANK